LLNKQVTNSESNWEGIGHRIDRLALDIIWNQWANLGSMANPTSGHEALRIIDPEALILASLVFQSAEKRINEVLDWWAGAGTPLLSVQRMKVLATNTNSSRKDLFVHFAELASRYGYRSWAKYAEKVTRLPDGFQRSELTLRGCPTLLLRLRAAFGVGAKADIIALLVGTSGREVTVSTISTHLSFTQTAVRDALKEMAMAGLVRESISRPATYSTSRKPWLELFQPGEEGHRHHPKWVMWSALFDFLISAKQICLTAAKSDQNSYVSASRARDLVESHRNAFEFHDVFVPDGRDYPGLEYQKAFGKVVENFERWVISGD